MEETRAPREEEVVTVSDQPTDADVSIQVVADDTQLLDHYIIGNN